MTRLWWIPRVGLLIPALLVLPGLMGASVSAPAPDDDRLADRHYARIQGHLQAEAEYGGLLGLPVPGWKVVALSHISTGLMSMAVDARQAGDDDRLQELGILLGEALRRGMAIENSPYSVPLSEVEDFNDWGFYLGHIALMMGCYRYVTGDSEHDILHRRIIRYQLARMSADGDQHARSYPNSYKWPADQALTLAAIHLYDRIHGSQLSVQPIRDWLSAVEAVSTDGMHPLTLIAGSALPVLENGDLQGPFVSAMTPRGSALSPTAFYMAQFAPDAAAELYASYRAARWRHRLGLGGFREWPQGEGGWDLEGGPILLGLGSISTTQGLAPARVFNDRAAYGSIYRSMLTLGVPEGWGPGRGYLLAPLLVEAWVFNGVTARAWFEPPPSTPSLTERGPPIPLASWLLLLADLGLLFWIALPVVQWLRTRQSSAPHADPASEPASETPPAPPEQPDVPGSSSEQSA